MITATAVAGLVALSASVAPARAAIAQKFAPAAMNATTQSSNYTGMSNSSMHAGAPVPGKAFDRFVQVWLENTDYATAASSPVFQQLAQMGMLLTSYHGVTHPSEPNYIASVGGDFFGLADDAFYHIPENITTVVDLLEEKNISWAGYSENLPEDGYQAYNWSSPNYLNTSAPEYAYYVRKHNPLVIYDSIALNASRAAHVRNFNDLANDVVNGTLPQWVFVTPNMVNDGHDTNIDFVGAWLQSWLLPLLNDTRFNDNRTLVLLTFDENETYEAENVVYSVLLGGALPAGKANSTDATFYTHYSALSSVQANWGLGSLGRQDTNATVSNVFQFVADATGYKNTKVAAAAQPMLNLTGVAPGPLSSELYTPFVAPNMSAVGAGGGKVIVRAGLDMSATSAGAPQNLTSGAGSPWMNATAVGGKAAVANATGSGSGASPSASGKSGAARTAVGGAAALAAAVFAASLLL